MRSQAHRIESEPPLDLAYLVKCLLCLGLIGIALYGAYLIGWAKFG